MVQNSTGLMHLEGHVYHFDGVVFGVYCSPKFFLVFSLLDFETPFCVNRNEGAIISALDAIFQD